jgi:hypothetical protein
MKPAGPSLLFLVMAAALAAQPAAPAPPVKTSGLLAQEIRAGLPKYASPATTTQAAAKNEPVPADPDLLVLPKFTVKEKRLPANDPDVWLTERAVQQKAMAAYQGSMTPLEWAMNSWFIPLFSAPPSVRARAAYQENKRIAEISRIAHLISVVGKVDPKQAAQLRDELNHDPDQR